MIMCNRDAIVSRMKSLGIKHDCICNELAIGKNDWHKKLRNIRSISSRQAKKVCDLLKVQNNSERDELFSGFELCDFDNSAHEFKIDDGELKITVVARVPDGFPSAGGLDLMKQLFDTGMVERIY